LALDLTRILAAVKATTELEGRGGSEARRTRRVGRDRDPGAAGEPRTRAHDLCDRSDRGALEVIIVDDGSDPPLAFDQTSLSVPVTLFHGRGTGPVRSRSLGWRAARAGVVLFTDDDVRVSRTWVDSACRTFDADSNLIAIAGRVGGGSYDWLFQDSVAAEVGGTRLTCNIS
jgi:hypothetical protein